MEFEGCFGVRRYLARLTRLICHSLSCGTSHFPWAQLESAQKWLLQRRIRVGGEIHVTRIGTFFFLSLSPAKPRPV